MDLHHHGDVETGPGLLDFAVNVYAGPRPEWLEAALLDGIAGSSAYPDVTPARAALAVRHGRAADEVLPTAGVAEAFTLVARLRPWRRPVVIHPQFTEPHSALEAAGHRVTVALCRAEDDFRLDPAAVPGDADLVVVGNPTNPTGVLHPAAAIRSLARAGRLVVVDEAFLDAVPGEPEAMAGEPGVLVLRSLTKHWSIPGIRAGYAIGEPGVIAGLRALQTPWSVSSPAIAAMAAIAGAAQESARRARELTAWREHLVGRNTAALCENEIARAVVESVAENTSDAVVAPLVWGAVCGVPGLLAYRAANTLDAMTGHHSARYERFGWAAARLDDTLNLPAARLTGVLTAGCAPAGARETLAAWRRDARRHPSPNAGVAEAAFAGALGIRLGGTNTYGGQVEHRALLGDGRAAAPEDITRAVRLARRVGAAAALVTAFLAAARPAQR